MVSRKGIARYGGVSRTGAAKNMGCRMTPNNQRTPKGGAKQRGGAKPHKENPHGKQFPTPPSPRYIPPPNVISLIKSLTNTQNFPQVTPSKTVFGGSPKMVSDGPSLRGFAPPAVFPPPLARPRIRCAPK